MNLKIKFNKEIHIFKGSQNFQEVLQYIKNAFKDLPSKFSLYYLDEDSDEITVSCQQDLESMVECNEKLPKLIIKELEQSQEGQEQEETKQSDEQKQEQQKQNQQQQQQQQQNPCDLFGNFLNMSQSFMEKCGEQKGQKGKGGCEFFKNMAQQFRQYTPQFEQMAQQFSNPEFFQAFIPQQGNQQEGFQNFAEQMNQFAPQFEEMAQQFANPEFFTAAFTPQQQQQQQQKPQEQKEQQQQNDEQVNEKDDQEEINQFLSKGPKEDSQEEQTQKEKILKKEFDEEILLKACTVSEVLGGEINDYLGVCEAYKQRDLDYVIERLTIDPKLTEKFSSYQ